MLHARDGIKLVTVRVDAKALSDYGEGDGPFEQYRSIADLVHGVASWKYDAGKLEHDGSVRLKSEDFET